MQTTKLFFMAALALTFAACSSDDNDIQTPAQPAKAEGIPFTATISIGQSASTRALTENGTTIEAAWADGEKVALIYTAGSTPTKTEAEVTKQTDGTATISATLESGATDGSDVTIIYPASAADGTTGNVLANVLAEQDGTLATIATNYDVRKGTGKLSISGGKATVNNGTAGTTVSLTNQFAIFKFTLSGQSIDATHPMIIKKGENTVVTTVTPSSSATSVCVAMPAAASSAYRFIVDTDNNRYIYSGTATIEAGKYYQTTLTMTARYPLAMADATVDDLGSLLGQDGKIYATGAAATSNGTIAVGVVAYIGTDVFTENGTTVGGSTFVGHGLVLCLKNAASGSDAQWSTETSAFEFGEDAKVTNADGLKRTTNVSGYTNTKTLAEKDDAATKYKAAYAAKNYTWLTAPAGTTGWFLPSAQQWVKMQTGLGGLEENSITWGSWFDTSHTAADKWEAALAKAGDGNYESMTSTTFLYYWSSSECSANYAVFLNVNATDTGDNCGFFWSYLSKDWAYSTYRVRPVLAF